MKQTHLVAFAAVVLAVSSPAARTSASSLFVEGVITGVTDDGNGVGPRSMCDMKKNRCELGNVAPQHQEVVQDLAAQWDAIARRIGARPEGKVLPRQMGRQ